MLTLVQEMRPTLLQPAYTLDLFCLPNVRQSHDPVGFPFLGQQ